MVKRIAILGMLALAVSGAFIGAKAQEIQVIFDGEKYPMQPIQPTGTLQKEWVPVPGKPPSKDVSSVMKLAGQLVNTWGQKSARNRAIEEGYEKARAVFRRDPSQQVFGYELEYYKTTQEYSIFTASQYEVHELRGSTPEEVLYSRLYREPEVRADKGKWEASELVIVPRGQYDGVGPAFGVDRWDVERFQTLASNPTSGDLFRQEMERRLDADDDFKQSQQNLREERRKFEDEADNAKALAKAQAERAENFADDKAKAAGKKAAEEATAAAKAASDAATKVEQERKKKETEYAAQKQKEADQKADADRKRELEKKAADLNDAEKKEYTELVEKAQDISTVAIVIPCGEGNNSRSCRETGEPIVCAVCNSIGDFRSAEFLGNYEIVPKMGSPIIEIDVYQFGKSKPIFTLKGLEELPSMKFGERQLPVPSPY